jgi:hypothetical protein
VLRATNSATVKQHRIPGIRAHCCIMDHLAFGSRALYSPPPWLTASTITPSLIPRERLNLGRFPTPVHAFSIPGTEDLGLTFYIKRDDLSSFDLSGNKVRKYAICYMLYVMCYVLCVYVILSLSLSTVLPP